MEDLATEGIAREAIKEAMLGESDIETILLSLFYDPYPTLRRLNEYLST